MTAAYMYACMHRGLGHAENILEIGCSEIASEAILGQKQGRSSYMARGVLYPIAVHTVGSHLSGVQLSELVNYSNARLAKPHPLFSATFVDRKLALAVHRMFYSLYWLLVVWQLKHRETFTGTVSFSTKVKAIVKVH